MSDHRIGAPPFGAAQIAELGRWLAATDIAELRLTGPGTTLHLRRDGTPVAPVGPSAKPTAPTQAAPTQTVPAPGVGRLRLAHPQRSQPLCPPGTAVQAGQLLALLQVGPLLQPVTAPQAGVLGRWRVDDHTLVGWGTPLADLHPLPPGDAAWTST